MKLIRYLEGKARENVVFGELSYLEKLDIQNDIFAFIDVMYLIKITYFMVEEILKHYNVKYNSTMFNLKLKYKNDSSNYVKDSLFDRGDIDKTSSNELKTRFKDKSDVFLNKKLLMNSKSKNIDDLHNSIENITNDESILENFKNEIIKLIKDTKVLNSKYDFKKLSNDIWSEFYVHPEKDLYEYQELGSQQKQILKKLDFDLFINKIGHDKVFHGLSDIRSTEKFNDEKYGDFENPKGYTTSQILKELNATVTDFVNRKSSKEEKKLYISDIFKNIKQSLGSNKTWGRFREVFDGYDHLLKIFPKNEYPDNKEMIIDEKLTEKIFSSYRDFDQKIFYKFTKQDYLPGFSKKQNETLNKFTPKHEELVQDFEAQQDFIMDQLKYILLKIGNDNFFYVNRLK
jgi:hypothetical protein